MILELTKLEAEAILSHVHYFDIKRPKKEWTELDKFNAAHNSLIKKVQDAKDKQ